MLKRLKRTFITIVMTLVGLVLASVMALSLYSSYSAQQRLIDHALQDGLNDSLSSVPTIGSTPPNKEYGHGSSMPVLAANISTEGLVLETSDSPVIIDPTVLTEVIQDALSSDADSGSVEAHRVAWRSKVNSDGSIRLVMVDTSSAYYTISSQVTEGVVVVILALGVLFAISWFLADWALKPVAKAWEQQRRFVSDASHELKTPLAVIIANTEILRGADELTDEHRRWVESTQEESQHMKALVSDLLQLSRLDEGMAEGSGVQIVKAPFDLSDLVEETSLEFDAVAFERECLIETAISPGIMLTGNADMIKQMLRTLLDNACKYAERGSTITVSLTDAAPHPELKVNNRGTTIDPEDLEHIFDRFYRTDKARSRQDGPGGFGLGLAIAKGIADSHGATIAAQSTDEKGTTFSVAF